ncbi:MAG: putative transport system permease protein [Frankiaceae bacterium]|nr:putative transport system permease protein [Frankiaceae bacterium]
MSAAGRWAAVRIARRDALRAKGRSALVLVMIGLPMLAIAFADVVARTDHQPPGEQARRTIGTADIVVSKAVNGRLTQYAIYDYNSDAPPVGENDPPPSERDVLALLPPGSRVEAWDTGAGVRVRVPGRAANVEERRLDATGLARGTVRLRAGRYARAAGEAVLSAKVAQTLGVRPGASVTMGEPARTFVVTGLAVDPESLSMEVVWVPPAAPLGARAQRRYAVDLPPGSVDTDALARLNDNGYMGQPRTWFFSPPPSRFGGGGPDEQSVGIIVLVVGLATLEVVLLAGTAFAVGARRQRRALALVAATGGDRKDVRRVVLSTGVVLGAVAAVLGIAGGVVVAMGLRSYDEGRLSGPLWGPLDLRARDLLAIVGIGAGTALLASLLPARSAARQPLVAALTGRRAETVTRKRVPVVALLAVAAGCVLAFWAAGDGRVPAGQVGSGRPANFTLVLVGAALAELGFVACAPSLVGLVGRLGARLPLSFRLAARDAARHRARSGPAVGAVVAAVAGSVAVSLYLASDVDRQRRAYEPLMPAGSVRISRAVGESFDANVRAAAARLPVREQFDIVRPTDACRQEGACEVWSLAIPPARQCAPGLRAADPRCVHEPRGDLLIGGPAVASWVTGNDDPAVAEALARGAVVVFDERFVEHGTVLLTRDFSDGRTATGVRLPAVVAKGRTFLEAPSGVLTEATAGRVHLPVGKPTSTILTTTRMPTKTEQAEAAAAAAPAGDTFDVYVERGFAADNALALLALVAASAVVTVGATGIATGLAAADSRPDLATLAAVGAAPRVRRRLAMAQAATVAALGSALGILAGLVPVIAVIAARAELRLVLPWATLAVTAAGVPLLAALVVGLFTRSRLPLERRLA